MGRHLYAHTVPALARLTVPISTLERALPFYEQVLRMTRLFVNHESAVLQGDGFEVQLVCTEGSPDGSGLLPSFRVPDLDDAIVAAIACGARDVYTPEDQPWGEHQITMRDPDGHLVCLVAPIG